MRGQLTILCENTVTRPGGLIGEHGFAVLLESDQGRFLFDTGQGLGILGNARVLGKDLTTLDGIILSHGHADHCGGLLQVLENCANVNLYAHPGVFVERYWSGRFERRANGSPWSREQVVAAGGQLIPVREFLEPIPGLYLSGEVPRHSTFETGDPNLMIAGEGRSLRPDPFDDDLSLALDTPRGLLVLVGCAHAGLVNILRHFRSQTGKPVFAVLGGTHLAPAGDEQFAATVDYLRRSGIERIGLAHCTGLARGGELAQVFPDKVVFANVGFQFDF